MELINRKGSVDDIRKSLKFINPSNEREMKKALARVSASHIDEQKHGKRATVLDMLMAKYNQLIKQLKQWHQNETSEKSASCGPTN